MPQATAPELPELPTPSRVVAGIAGWRCWLEADTPQAVQLLARYAAAAGPRGYRIESGVSVQGADGTPRIAVLSHGAAVDCLDLLSGPEGKRLVRVEDPSRVLYRDLVFGQELAVENAGGELRVLNGKNWPFYAFSLYLSLFLHETGSVAIHGAVVGIPGRNLVLIGPSGSGKSTLCWALSERGADYHSDEHALLTAPDFELHTVSRPLCLRPGGLEAIGRPIPGTWYEAKPGDRKYAVGSAARSPLNPAAPISLYFPCGFNAAPELDPMPGGEAVRRIVYAMGHREKALDYRLDLAAELVNRFPCYRLMVGPPEATAELLMAHARHEQ